MSVIYRSRLARLAVVAAAATGIALVAGCSSGTSTSSTSTTPAAAAPSSAPAATSAAPGSSAPGGATISTASSHVGTILVDASGKSIYILTSDKPNGASACTSQCLQFWPPVPAPSPLPSGLAGITATLGTFMAADGSSQLTINGYPAYTFSMDTGPGMTSGQGVKSFNGVWWLVSPSGKWITTAAASSSNASASKSKSGGGYGY